MTRVPKFRAWYGIEMYDEPVICNGEFYLDWRDFEDGKTYDGAVLMQSTGLEDRNGTEIFEGDIVVMTYNGDGGLLPCKGVVRMSKGRYMVCDDKNEYWAELYSEIFSTEIIGNIHENKELLE